MKKQKQNKNQGLETMQKQGVRVESPGLGETTLGPALRLGPGTWRGALE